MGFRAALILIALAWAGSGVAAEESALLIQQRVKAAFLSKFAAYVEWPSAAFAQPESPIVIGVAGSDAMTQELEQAVAGRTVAGRPLLVRRLARGDPVHDCCHILFVAGGEPARRADILSRAEGHPVLTVTDAQAVHPRGSVINFLAANGRLRFDISREAADRNRLHLRSQLLAVARQVSPP